MTDIDLNEDGNSPEAQTILDESKERFRQDGNPDNDVVNRPATPEEMDILLRDKLIATAEAFGLPTTGWVAVEPGDFPVEDGHVAYYELTHGDVVFGFDSDRGVVAKSGEQLYSIHSAEDASIFI